MNLSFTSRRYSNKQIRKLAINNHLSNDDWMNISGLQTLPEDFIREFQNKVNWNNISIIQNLSEEFIREFQDKVSWEHISLNVKIKISDKFCEEFDDKLKQDWQDRFVWQINSEYHRILGPAVIYYDRTLGPTVIHSYKNQYYYRGEHLKDIHSDEQYRRWLNLRAFA